MKQLIAWLGVVAGALITLLPGTARAVPSPAMLVVPTQFSTIQAAVDAAQPGDRVVVLPGTYTGEVVVTKDLVIRGSGVGRTIVKAPTALTSYGVHLPDGRDVTAIVRVGGGAHVRMSGLTVTGPIPCATEVSGVNVVQAATLALVRARVTNMHVAPGACGADDAAGRAVVYGLPPHILAFGVHGSPAYGRIGHVLVDRYQHAGVSVTGPATGAVTRVLVDNDVVVGGARLPSFQFGIHIAAGAVARVHDNVITGNICAAEYCGPDPINEAQAAGVMVQSAMPGTIIARNLVAGNDAGIYQVDSPDCCALTGNLLVRNRFFGIVIQDGDGSTYRNTILGGQVGVGVVADFVDTTGVLHGDHIIGATTAVRELDCCGVTATAVVVPS